VSPPSVSVQRRRNNQPKPAQSAPLFALFLQRRISEETVRIPHCGLGEGSVAEQVLSGAAENLANLREPEQSQPPEAALDAGKGGARQSSQHLALCLGHAKRAAALAQSGADTSAHRITAVHGLCSVET
jgi:hypothetical protein